MVRKHKPTQASGYCILLVDDDEDYLQATRLLLESEGHEVLTVTSGPEALELLRQQSVHLVLLDYFMPDMTGEQVVESLRGFDPDVQVILQTGYANERPPREMLRRLDIQGYYDKSEGPEKLLLWADAGLKAASAFRRMQQQRKGMRYILDATPLLHKIQPLSDLFFDILTEATGLMGTRDAFLAVLPERSVSTAEANGDHFLTLDGESIEDDPTGLVIHAGSGRFQADRQVVDEVGQAQFEVLLSTLRRGDVDVAAEATIAPLRIGELTLGVIYLAEAIRSADDIELLQVFCNQAAVAIQNIQLYSMAALDPLTGVHARRFFEMWLRREVRTTFRSHQPLSLLLCDMDALKHINDTAGHLAGDQALATMGKVLRQATRENDIVGRYGGDEFAVILPRTGSQGAQRVASRILKLLEMQEVSRPEQALPLRSSMGLSMLGPQTEPLTGFDRPLSYRYFQQMAEALIANADAALYRAKNTGGHRLEHGNPTSWGSLSEAPPPSTTHNKL